VNLCNLRIISTKSMLLNTGLYSIHVNVMFKLDRFIEKCAHELTSIATFNIDENENFELLKRFGK
jgi:hypothetical protein